MVNLVEYNNDKNNDKVLIERCCEDPPNKRFI